MNHTATNRDGDRFDWSTSDGPLWRARVCGVLHQVEDLSTLTDVHVEVGGVQEKVLDGCGLVRERDGWIRAGGVMILTPAGTLMPQVKRLRFTIPRNDPAV